MPGQGRKRIEGEAVPVVEGELAPSQLEETGEPAGREADEQDPAVAMAADDEDADDEDADEDDEDEDDEDEDDEDDEDDEHDDEDAEDKAEETEDR